MATPAQSSITDVTRIVAFITEASSVHRIHTYIGEPAQPPPIAPAGGHRRGTMRPYHSPTGKRSPNRSLSTCSTSRCSGSPLRRPSLRSADSPLRAHHPKRRNRRPPQAGSTWGPRIFPVAPPCGTANGVAPTLIRREHPLITSPGAVGSAIPIWLPHLVCRFS
jgi:hypothetical protein